MLRKSFTSFSRSLLKYPIVFHQNHNGEGSETNFPNEGYRSFTFFFVQATVKEAEATGAKKAEIKSLIDEFLGESLRDDVTAGSESRGKMRTFGQTAMQGALKPMFPIARPWFAGLNWMFLESPWALLFLIFFPLLFTVWTNVKSSNRHCIAFKDLRISRILGQSCFKASHSVLTLTNTVWILQDQFRL